MVDRPEVSPDEDVLGAANPAGPTSDGSGAEAELNEARAEGSEMERLRGELDALKVEHDALHDRYVRLHAEFDNFRKRTAKERIELLGSAGADVVRSVLPVLDDLERAIAHNKEMHDIDAVKHGFELISQKFAGIMAAQGVKPMQAKGQPFDPDLHDAISQAPAPTPDLKGKVLDMVETGYLLNDKVLRYAKVVVGQ